MCIFGGGKKTPAPTTPSVDTQALIAQQQQAQQQAQEQTTQLITDLTKGFQEQITQTQQQSQAQIDAINKANTDLTQQITQQQGEFAKSQQDLADQFSKANSAQITAMQEVIKSLQAGRQDAKKPNYSKALAENKRLNSAGLSATNLTGGVAVSSLPLSQTSLLGA